MNPTARFPALYTFCLRETRVLFTDILMLDPHDAIQNGARSIYLSMTITIGLQRTSSLAIHVVVWFLLHII